ncbi:MAG: sensor histidine kinase [Cyanobacteriota bacterium]|nr:sensor histidine kinase [Cyanobacteriota bacterium]
MAELRAQLAEGVPPGRGNDDAVRRQWWAALDTIQSDILLGSDSTATAPDAGIWLASPLPALYEPALLERLKGWVWAPVELAALLPPGGSLLPAQRRNSQLAGGFRRLALNAEDGTDPMLVVITPAVQVALCLDGPSDARRLVVRFDPGALSAALALLDERLLSEDATEAGKLRHSLQQLGTLRSDERLAERFWPRLGERLASMAPSVTLQPLIQGSSEQPTTSNRAVRTELALLEALTHEVRTPLATIRTLIRSLLRRRDISDLVRHRLEQIDGECSEQIDRFGLIFLAAELQDLPESDSATTRLARTDLSALLEQLGELWQRQLSRRSLTLELVIAADLPAVLSDPVRLETMLGGLVDRFSRGLPAGSTVTVSLQAAGSRLKLRLGSSVATAGGVRNSGRDDGPGRQELVGPVLSWNPTTGSLQLSREATQRLFARMGGRLTERGEHGLTVFFPIC